MFYQIIAATAGAESGDTNVFSALGIDWKLLGIQLVAFVLLVAILKKFVYPQFMEAVDRRQAAVEEIQRASVEAQESSNKTRLEIENLLDEARKEAAGIVSTAKDEADSLVESSEEKARMNAERIVSDARAEIERDVETIKKELHNQTVELVALATEKVVGKANSKKVDNEMISQSIKETK